MMEQIEGYAMGSEDCNKGEYNKMREGYNKIRMSQALDGHILSRFEVVKMIGSGAYGYVWRVVQKTTRQMKALKKNYDAFSNSTDAQRTYREIMFLMELKHPSIVRLEEVIKADNNKDIYLVFEHMDVDLHVLIRERILAEKHRRVILYQVAKAIHYLHGAGLVHRDIKPANVLVNEDCDAKLCDFGLVRSVADSQQEDTQILTEYIATRWYRAPQILLGSVHYTKAIDIWSFGCLLAEMQRGKALFAGTSTLNQLEKVLLWTGTPSDADIRSLRVQIPTETLKMISRSRAQSRRDLLPAVDEQCMDLISRALEFDPAKRIQIQDILTHPYLAEHFKPSDLILPATRLHVPVDDNQRLTLKDYRNKIYNEIKRKSGSLADVTSSTLYRIGNPLRKPRSKPHDFVEDYPKKQGKTLSMGKQEERTSLLKGTKNRHLKTIEKQWNPFEEKGSKHIKLIENCKEDWIQKKRSVTQSNANKKVRLLPSPADLRGIKRKS